PNGALPYLIEARELLQQDEDRIQLQKVEQTLGASYLKSDRLDEAESAINNALRLAREIRSPQMLYEINLIASELSAKKLDYKAANEFLHEALRQHQLLFSESNQRAIREMEVRMAIETRRREEAGRQK